MRARDRALVDWLRDIETAAAAIVDRTEPLTFDAFCADELLVAYVLLNVQIMGEASAWLLRLHPEYLDVTPLPWAGMRLMRNRLMHGYFDVDLAIVWDTARDDAADLLSRIRPLIAAEET